MTAENGRDSIAAQMSAAELHVRRGDIGGAIAIVEPLLPGVPADWRIRERLGDLKAMGIREIFLPRTPTSAAVNAIRSAVTK